MVENKACYAHLVALPAVFDIDPSVVEEAVPLVVVDDVDNVEEAESVVKAGQTYQGSVDQLVDIPVNMRNRLDQPLGNTNCGFLITEVTTKASVTPSTKLWALARELGVQVREMLEKDQHLGSHSISHL